MVPAVIEQTKTEKNGCKQSASMIKAWKTNARLSVYSCYSLSNFFMEHLKPVWAKPNKEKEEEN